jgi:hypothetical protein
VWVYEVFLCVQAYALMKFFRCVELLPETIPDDTLQQPEACLDNSPDEVLLDEVLLPEEVLPDDTPLGMKKFLPMKTFLLMTLLVMTLTR